ncbi:MAG: hypothetical protein CM15mP74_16820 [Halieaceae bacterium]|nr:MAG: hypothetical protein CM15mP74_16820 [Halieaceae bacterium]
MTPLPPSHRRASDSGVLALPSEPVTLTLCINRLTPRAAKGTARERATPATKAWQDFHKPFSMIFWIASISSRS